MYKYLVSYCIVFIIPFILAMFFWNKYFFKMYVDDTYVNIRSDTKRFRDITDSNISKIFSDAYYMSDEDIFSDHFNTNAFNRSITYTKLNNYSLKSDLVSNVVFFEDNLNFIISSYGSCRNQDVTKYLFNYKKWLFQDLISDVYKFEKPCWRYSEEIELFGSSTNNYISFIYPFKKNNSNLKKVFIYNIKETDFFKGLNIYKDLDDKEYLIIDARGEIVCSSVSREYPKDIFEYVLSNSSTEPKLYINEHLIVSFIKSSLNDWTYINILSIDVAMQKINQIKNIAMIFIILSAILGALIIYLLTYLNYNPLKDLYTYIKSMYQTMPDEENEIETAKKVIQNLIQKESYMKEKLSTGVESIKTTMMYDMIRGNIKNVKEYNLQGKEYGISLKNAIFHIVVFFIKDYSNLKINTSDMIKEIKEQFPGNISAEGIEGIYKNTLIFTVSSNFLLKDILKETLINIRKKFIEEHSIDFIIGVSEEVGNEDNIYDAYMESMLSIEHYETCTPNKAYGNIIFYDRNMVVAFDKYPDNEMETFKTALIDLDLEVFFKASRYLIDYIRTKNISLFMAQCICYDMLTTIFKFIIQIDKQDSFTLGTYKQINIDFNINNLESMVEFACMRAEEYIRSKVVIKDDYLLKEIKKYIKNNFTNPDFSLYNLADAFNMSLSNVSHYFKKNSGITLSEYISDLRIIRAKDFLKNTELTVNEISEKIGYINTSSFIRRFKQITNITPSEFRDLHKNY